VFFLESPGTNAPEWRAALAAVDDLEVVLPVARRLGDLPLALEGVGSERGRVALGERGVVAPDAQHADISQDANPDEGGTPAEVPAPVDPDTGLPVDPPTGLPVDPELGAVDSLLQGGSLLDVNVDVDANANLTAPINGAVAANANVAAPIDAAVAANIGSDGATAQALADQQVNINQTLDDVSAEATAEQDATIDQQ